MGVNFTQYCYVGFQLEESDLTFEQSPDIFVEEQRYDTKTGKPSHKEKILMKEAIISYQFDDLQSDDIHELIELVTKKYNINVHCDYDEDIFTFGYSLCSNYDYGNVDLIEDEASFEELLSLRDRMKKLFPAQEIKLYFVTSVG